MIIYNILIIVFFYLVLYSIYLEWNKREGLTDISTPSPNPSPSPSPSPSVVYKNYPISNDNALILSQQNAGNIAFLKDQVDEIPGLKKRVDDLTSQMEIVNTQLYGLAKQQATTAIEAIGASPTPTPATPKITGTY
jgi:hypothetical protein